MKVEAAGRTDLGMVRHNNEDNLCVEHDLGLYIVADGMGGHASGEVASRLAVDIVRDHLRQASRNAQVPVLKKPDPALSQKANLLADAIRLANQVVFEAARSDQKNTGMGTTLTAVWVDREGFAYGHVGDSRLYRIRGEGVEQLSSDHSLVMEWVRKGRITLEEAEKSPQKNVLTRAVGAEGSVEVEAADVPGREGDVLLLCSDGLTKMLDEDQMVRAVREHADLEEACGTMIDMANQAGGVDNVTVVLARVTETGGQGRRLWERIRGLAHRGGRASGGKG